MTEGQAPTLLHNPIRAYAWGSRTVLAQLLGRHSPAAHPEAELWLGAHPADPSLVDIGGVRHSLLDVLTSEPEAQLGPEVIARWGPRLPFLLKVLAAEEPLSLQAHPSAEQAAEGYAAEEAAGVAPSAEERNYSDPHHKPELICALTEFHALAGFRDAAVSARLLAGLDCEPLRPSIEMLGSDPGPEELRALFTTWITLPQRALDELLPDVLDACVAHIRGGGEFAAECRVALQLGEAYPGDAGVLASLLLNHIVLAPGEAIYLPAGNLHAYLHGTGVEIMANSDNVLRGGLTPKHVDVAELLRVLDFTPQPLPVVRGTAEGDVACSYRTPAPEFRLCQLRWHRRYPSSAQPVRCDSPGPQIVLVTEGALRVQQPGRAERMLTKGEAIWLPASDPAAWLEPAGEASTQAFWARTGVGEEE